jgi:hypothetical protein
MKRYKYVGPYDIKEKTKGCPPGTPIRSEADLATWINANKHEVDWQGLLWATFKISTDYTLYIASRNSEHIACAAGKEVLSAGEMAFDSEAPSIEEVTNQSTGFCPEPESWPAVARAIEKANLPSPGYFTQEFVFRRCEKCGQRNIVKDGVFECAVCMAQLPEDWNF